MASRTGQHASRLKRAAQRVHRFIRYGPVPRAVPWTGDGLRVVVETPGAYTPDSWALAFAASPPSGPFDLRCVVHPGHRDVLLPTADVYVTATTGDVDPGLLRRLRLLQFLTAGADGARRLGRDAGTSLRVCTTAGVASEGLAEHALALLLALARQLPQALRQQAEGVWSQGQILAHVVEVRGRTVGVLGLGHAGRRLCTLFGALDMRVMSWDGRPGRQPPVDLRVEWMESLDALLAAVDYLVLCLPHNANTHHLIDDRALSVIKPGAAIINVSRGGLIDAKALARALRAGRVGGAGLDVLDEEPPRASHPLLGAPNLILTPHVAGNMHTYRQAIQARCVENVQRLSDGAPLLGLLPPS